MGSVKYKMQFGGNSGFFLANISEISTIRKQKDVFCFYFYVSEIPPMSQIDPQKIANAATALRSKPIVSDACIGCGACIAISGDVFEYNDEGYSIVKEISDYEGKDVDDSIVACPVDAISWCNK